MQQYELIHYGPEASQVDGVTEYAQLSSDGAARSRAGRLAKKIGGPVDLARAGAADWNDRYITTVAPSEHHAAGWRCERLT